MNRPNRLKKLQNEMFFRDLEFAAIYQQCQQQQHKETEKKRQRKLYKKYLKHMKRKLVYRKMKRYHAKKPTTSKSISNLKSNVSSVLKYGLFAHELVLETQQHRLSLRI
jgi:hypothetical protein